MDHIIKMKVVFATLSILILAGCAGSPTSLRQDPGFKRAVTVEENYQSVYRRVLGILRQCTAYDISVGQIILENTLSPESKRAEILEINTPLYAKNYIFIYDFIGKNNNETEVVFYAALGLGGQRVEPYFLDWVHNRGKECS